MRRVTWGHTPRSVRGPPPSFYVRVITILPTNVPGGVMRERGLASIEWKDPIDDRL